MELLEKLIDPEFVKKVNDNVAFETDGSIRSRDLEDFSEEEKSLMQEQFLAVGDLTPRGQFTKFNPMDISYSDSQEIFKLVPFGEKHGIKLSSANYHDTRFSSYKILLKVTVDCASESMENLINRVPEVSIKIEPVKLNSENYCLPLESIMDVLYCELFNIYDDNIFNSFVFHFDFKMCGRQIDYSGETFKLIINHIKNGNEIEKKLLNPLLTLIERRIPGFKNSMMKEEYNF